MKIKKITNQHRRDFTAIYVCEHCGYEETRGGYDDANFHKNVIPSMACLKCGKKADDTYRPLTPKYPANKVVQLVTHAQTKPRNGAFFIAPVYIYVVKMH